VALRPVASPSTVVLVRQDSPRTATAAVSWHRTDPTRFPVTLSTGGGTVVALAETFAPGWTAPGLAPAGDHLAVQGWMNAWRVPAGDHAGSLAYAPERRARLARLALPAGLLAALVWVAVAHVWRRRTMRAGR